MIYLLLSTVLSKGPPMFLRVKIVFFLKIMYVGCILKLKIDLSNLTPSYQPSLHLNTLKMPLKTLKFFVWSFNAIDSCNTHVVISI